MKHEGFTPGPWYEVSTGNHQGLIVSEANGANVAVSYDKKDAALVASAPDLLAENERLRGLLARIGNVLDLPPGIGPGVPQFADEIRDVLAYRAHDRRDAIEPTQAEREGSGQLIRAALADGAK